MAEIFWPFPLYTVSEWPGTRPKMADHVGTDFAVPQGTPLRATMSGWIDIVWNDGLGAWVINIISPDGTVVRNGHMSYMHPKDGQWVNAGDYIGNTGGRPGTTGAGFSFGEHLHWEIRTNNGWSNAPGNWYDPRNLAIRSFDSLNGGGAPAVPVAPAINPRLRNRRRKGMFINLQRTLTFAVYELGVPGSWEEFTLTQEAANALATQRGNAMPCTAEFFASRRDKYAPKK